MFKCDSGKNWYVLCPGPSLTLLHREIGPPEFGQHDRVVAVNGAILKARQSAHFWAVGDPEVFKTCAGQMDPLPLKTVIWTHTKFGRESHESLAGWTFESRQTFYKFNNCSYAQITDWVDLGPYKDWANYSFFCAIALAVLCNPASITIYGADFMGDGYFLPNIENERTNHSADRWRREKELYRNAVDALKRQNILIGRVTV